MDSYQGVDGVGRHTKGRKTALIPPIMSESNEIGIIQFGEGNFLRCFVDWMIHELRKQELYERKVALVQPIEQGRVSELADRGGKYHCILQGIKERRAVSQIEEIDVFGAFNNPYQDFEGFLELALNPELELIVSNTTEAGIQFIETDRANDRPPSGFPGKLTLLLNKRFETFPEKEIHVVPCELIEKNGDTLKHCILSYIDLWNLSDGFKSWLEKKVHFYNTLVDRIVPGHPKDADDDGIRNLGASDPFATVGEYYHQWVIEKGRKLEELFPFRTAGLNVIYPDALKAYRDRKVRLLNGAHTAMVSVGIRAGIETVGGFLKNEPMRTFLEGMIVEEIAPTIQQDQAEVRAYAQAVIERFENPYIKHRLCDISLNSISKFKTRLFPIIADYMEQNDTVPERITYCLVSLIESIKGNENPDAFKDDPELISFIKSQSVEELVRSEALWGSDSFRYAAVGAGNS